MNKDPLCDEEIRAIRSVLPDAVNSLLTTTISQWEIESQKFLMKACQHGKTFLTNEEFNFNTFVRNCRDLRILNNLRNSDSPRLLTYEQYQTLEPKELIKRLMKSQNFFLAHEISLFLNMKRQIVYEKWAIAKIKVKIQ